MKFSLITSLVTASIVTGVAAAPTMAEKVSYDGYKVFRVKTQGRGQAVEEKLSSLAYEQWSNVPSSHIDISVAPGEIAAFEALNLDFEVMHEDLGASIKVETSSLDKKHKRDVNDPAWFDEYHDYEDHIQYFTDLQALFPNNSEIISAGESYEGRDIFGIHLWGDNGPGQPAVLYHGTVHAREWITAPVVEYITSQIINGYLDDDSEVLAYLNSYDFYIFPFVNPDGFVYTQVSNRLWRKNRQPGPSGSACYGRDINRNWEFAWNANSLGASTNPCSETFKGLEPSDAPENRGLDSYVRKLRDGAGIKLFIDWHSYGQYILSPYGYSENVFAPELDEWTRASRLVSDTIRDSSTRRTTFTYGPSGATLYITTGAAPDHVYSIGGADFSYTIELPDTGRYGFVLPPSAIRGAAEEQWEGQKVLYSLL